MKKNETNKKINVTEIIAMFVAYMQQQMEYTDMRMKEMKEWELDECEYLDCESEIISVSRDAEPAYDDTFSKEWL